MKKTLGIILSVALVVTCALPAYKVSTNVVKGTVLKTYSIGDQALKSIANSKDAKSAAVKVNDLKGNDYEAAVHKVLDKYYGEKDYASVSKFEQQIDSRAKSIVNDYREADQERKDEKSLKYEANTSILTFGADTEKSQIKAIVKDSYGKVDYIHKCTDGSYLVKVENTGLTAKKAANTYADYVETNSSEINGKVTQIAEAWDMINDPYRYNEYYLSNLKVGDAWSYINGKAHSKVKVAIIDGGGIDINSNVDLTNVSNKSLSVVYNEDNSSYAMTGLNADFNTSNMHMINGAGLIGAQSNNGSQVAGVAAGTDNSIVDLVNVAIPLTVDKIAVGLDYASSVGCKVANLSLFHEGSYDYEEAAVNRFTNNGGTVVAGAGNNGADLNGFPSDYGNVISIIATNEDNSRRGTSNFGWECDFCAPGTNITVAGPADQTWVTNGTSMASPIAAGVVAMMYSVNSGLNKTSVHNILKDTAQDLGGAGRDYEYAYGLINAGAAVAQAGGGSNQQTQTTTQAQTQAPTQAPTTKASIDPNNATYENVPGSTIYSYSVGSDATIVNVQNPGWSEGNYSGDGIYFHVPSGISSIKVNDGAGAHIEGAGGLVFLSALNNGTNKIDVKYATGETTFYIKKEAVATTTATPVVNGTELLNNTSFNGGSNWETFTNKGATFTFNGNGSVNVNVPEYNDGESWGTQIKQFPIHLDSSKYYVATFVATSSATKKVQLLMQTTDYQTTDVKESVQIGAGETKLVKAVFKPSKTADYLYGVMMGYIDNFSSAATTLKIDSVSLKVYNTESEAQAAASGIAQPTQTPTTQAPTTTKAETTKAETTTAQQTTKAETTAQNTTKTETTAQQTTKAQTTAQQTTKEPTAEDLDPTTLTYKEYTTNNAKPIEYAVVKGITGLVDPIYEDAGTTFSILFYAGLNKANSITVNGSEPANGVVKVNEGGVIRINPTKLTQEYSVFDFKYDNGEELIFVVKKNLSLETTKNAGESTQNGGQPGETTKVVDPSNFDPEQLTYKEFKAGNSKIGYSLVEGVTGIVDPVYEDAGSNLTIFYSGALGIPTSVKINDVEKPEGIFKNSENGVTRLNPSKLTEEYSVIRIKFENGEELVSVIKKEATVIPTGGQGESQTGSGTDIDPTKIDLSKLEYDVVTSGAHKIGYSVINGVTGLSNPQYSSDGATFRVEFSTELGEATEITIDGRSHSEMSHIQPVQFENSFRINPNRFEDDSYHVVSVKFENGEQLVYAIKKGDPENPQIITTQQQTTKVVTTTANPYGDDFTTPVTVNGNAKAGGFDIAVNSSDSYSLKVAIDKNDQSHIKIQQAGYVGHADGATLSKALTGLEPNSVYTITIPISSTIRERGIQAPGYAGLVRTTGDSQELECTVTTDENGNAELSLGFGALSTDNIIDIYKETVKYQGKIQEPETEEITEAPTTTQQVVTQATVATTAKITVAKVAIKKVFKKKKSAKKLKLKIKKVADAKGYQVAVFTSKKNAKKAKKAIVKKFIKSNKINITVSSSKLAKKAKLFVRVRAYKKVNDEAIYGAWSTVKAVKIQ